MWKNAENKKNYLQKFWYHFTAKYLNNLDVLSFMLILDNATKLFEYKTAVKLCHNF